MVGVHVGTDDAGDGSPAHKTFKQRLPDLARLVQGQTGVDDGPAFAVLQQPQVDVIQGHGHGEAHPVNPIGDALGFARGWVRAAAPGVLEAAIDFHGVLMVLVMHRGWGPETTAL